MLSATFRRKVRKSLASGPKLYGGQTVDEAVEAFFEEGQHLSVSPFVLVGGHNVIFRMGVQNLHHLPYQLRPLL